MRRGRLHRREPPHVGLRADLDVYATFEGDNNVLLQLVAKRLLTDYSRKFATRGCRRAGPVRRGAGRRGGDPPHRAARLAQTVADFGSTARSVGQLRETDAQRQLLTDRVQTMVAEIAARLRNANKLPKMEAAQLFNSNQNALIEAARAHAELLQWEAFTAGPRRRSRTRARGRCSPGCATCSGSG